MWKYCCSILLALILLTACQNFYPLNLKHDNYCGNVDITVSAEDAEQDEDIITDIKHQLEDFLVCHNEQAATYALAMRFSKSKINTLIHPDGKTVHYTIKIAAEYQLINAEGQKIRDSKAVGYANHYDTESPFATNIAHNYAVQNAIKQLVTQVANEVTVSLSKY